MKTRSARGDTPLISLITGNFKAQTLLDCILWVIFFFRVNCFVVSSYRFLIPHTAISKPTDSVGIVACPVRLGSQRGTEDAPLNGVGKKMIISFYSIKIRPSALFHFSTGSDLWDIPMVVAYLKVL
jgi:hypothetical protein